MAFRSELEAAQHRAESAEAEAQRLKLELTSQAARMDRVAEIEGQLEVARAKLREQGPKSQTYGVLAGAVLGTLLAGGAAYFHAHRHAASDRATEAEREDRHAEALRRASASTDDVRLELGMISAERDVAQSVVEESSRDMRTLLLAFSDAPSPELAATHPIYLGRVVSADGSTPVRVGMNCEVIAAEACAGTIRCGDVPMHTFGCRGHARTEIRADGYRLTVTDPEWRVTIHTQLTR